MKKIILVLLVIYIITPLVAGYLQYWDCRGPLVYPSFVHKALYSFTFEIINGEEARAPFRERTWFYGIKGDLYKSAPAYDVNSENVLEMR